MFVLDMLCWLRHPWALVCGSLRVVLSRMTTKSINHHKVCSTLESSHGDKSTNFFEPPIWLWWQLSLFILFVNMRDWWIYLFIYITNKNNEKYPCTRWKKINFLLKYPPNQKASINPKKISFLPSKTKLKNYLRYFMNYCSHISMYLPLIIESEEVS